MPRNILSSLLNRGEAEQVTHLDRLADRILFFERDFSRLSNEELMQETENFRARIKNGESLDQLLPEAFAAVREASWRTLHKKHFRTQIMGGIVLHTGNVAEMKTGEGKSLTATLPAYLNALTGNGVHIVTVNDFLAMEQSEQMGRVFSALGLTTGCILGSMNSMQRRDEYACDITYGTNNEFGFDYLRDNIALSVNDRVQRARHYAIIDEIDSILIDDARTPLIISQADESDPSWHIEIAKIVHLLEGEDKRHVKEKESSGPRRRGDYIVDRENKTISIGEDGIDKIEDLFGIDNLYDPSNAFLVAYLDNALRAKELMTRDKDYIVDSSGEVHIVDVSTGRVLEGRRFNAGLHQAIEAKERVKIKDENRTQATITIQNYFRGYEKMSGMTGTAQTEALELAKTYDLDVVKIPTHRPNRRIDHPDEMYVDEDSKFAALINKVSRAHMMGQPVLIGTTSIADSERVSGLLTEAKIKHSVLNAKEHAREASIVAQAGVMGAVTVATNMAGRGTDILLGGNHEFATEQLLRQQGLDPHETPMAYQIAWDNKIDALRDAHTLARKAVVERGGLFVIGTQRHNSRRIDDQLIGRAGRQGDPGESVFLMSVEDPLFVHYDPTLKTKLGQSDETGRIHVKDLSKITAKAQSLIERTEYEQRKNTLKYDDILSAQRKTIYSERNRILTGSADSQIRNFAHDVVTETIADLVPREHELDTDVSSIIEELSQFYPVSISVEDMNTLYGDASKLSRSDLIEEFTSDINHAITDLIARYTDHETALHYERLACLRVIDEEWSQHLDDAEILRQAVSMRTAAGRDPLIEFTRDVTQMFNDMIHRIKRETLTSLFGGTSEIAAQRARYEVTLRPLTSEDIDRSTYKKFLSDSVKSVKPIEEQIFTTRRERREAMMARMQEQSSTQKRKRFSRAR